jgi:hypothetical protein
VHSKYPKNNIPSSQEATLQKKDILIRALQREKTTLFQEVTKLRAKTPVHLERVEEEIRRLTKENRELKRGFEVKKNNVRKEFVFTSRPIVTGGNASGGDKSGDKSGDKLSKTMSNTGTSAEVDKLSRTIGGSGSVGASGNSSSASGARTPTSTSVRPGRKSLGATTRTPNHNAALKKSVQRTGKAVEAATDADMATVGTIPAKPTTTTITAQLVKEAISRELTPQLSGDLAKSAKSASAVEKTASPHAENLKGNATTTASTTAPKLSAADRIAQMADALPVSNNSSWSGSSEKSVMSKHIERLSKLESKLAQAEREMMSGGSSGGSGILSKQKSPKSQTPNIRITQQQITQQQITQHQVQQKIPPGHKSAVKSHDADRHAAAGTSSSIQYNTSGTSAQYSFEAPERIQQLRAILREEEEAEERQAQRGGDVDMGVGVANPRNPWGPEDWWER